MNKAKAVSKKKGAVPIDFENDREFRAHIYQQLADLQPFLTPETEIAVSIDPKAKSDEGGGGKKILSLNLIAKIGDHRLVTEGKNADAYEALNIAKRKMLDQLDAYYESAIDSDERDDEIDSIVDRKGTLH